MSEKQQRIYPLLLIATLALAAGLRFYRLDAQSFWNDEGNSVRIAERSIQHILDGAAGDIHPPLYYLCLHFWQAVVGNSEFAIRTFSVIGGVGLVALIYGLGAALFDRPAGLAAAVLAAINPFQIYYSQEARSYIWVALLASAAITTAWRWCVAKPERRLPWLIGYGASVAAGLYTHYLFAVVLIPLNLIVFRQVILGRRHYPVIKTLGTWLLGHLLVVLLYLPWAPIAYRQLTTWPSFTDGVSVGQAVWETFHLLGLGRSIPQAESTIGLLGFGFPLLLGLVPRREADGVLLSVAWVLIPTALILALGLYTEAFLKFLLVISPAFCLLVGHGITRPFVFGSRDAPGRTVGPIVLPVALSIGLILSFDYQSLQNMYTPSYVNDSYRARANYRGMARHIQSVARPGDAIILNAANQWEVFTYYYPDAETIYPLPRSRPVQETEVVAELVEISAGSSRIFAIFWGEAESDPDRVVERWLDQNTFKAADIWWGYEDPATGLSSEGDVRLVTYAVPAEPPTQIATPTHAAFGDRISLQGYTLLADQLYPGDIIQITLFWETLGEIGQRYKVFLQLRHGSEILAQQDSEPGGGLEPTSTWQSGELRRDNHGILVMPETPPGIYGLYLGLYAMDDPSVRLPVQLAGRPAGDELELAPITIEEWRP